MKKNILFFTALKANDPNMFNYMEWSLKTWKYYAQKHNCEIFILEDPLYDTEWMRPTWQCWYVYDLLEANNIEYNQVALIDIDTMVHWNTPNIFELSNNGTGTKMDSYEGNRKSNDLLNWVLKTFKTFQSF